MAPVRPFAVNREKSKTYDKFLEGGLEINYLDDSYVHGDYFHDAFNIGDSTLKNLTMGLGLNTTLMHGVVGIGYMANEASVETAKIQYDNLPVALAKANVTNSIAYSLWLNDFGKGPPGQPIPARLSKAGMGRRTRWERKGS